MDQAFEYFWLEKTRLPGPMGYGLFSAQHLLTLAVVILIITFVYAAFRKWDEDRQRRFLKAAALVMPPLEAFKIAVLGFQGVFDPSYAPLYLCSMGIFLFPVAAFSKRPALASAAAAVGLLIIAPGSLAALLFPNWIGFYPVFSFLSLYSYFWHGILLLFPICAWRAGIVVLRKDSIPRAYLFFIVMIPVILVLDRLLHQNYWFIERPDLNNPFLGIYNALGYPLYLLCLISIALILSFIFWAVFYAAQKRREKSIN